MSESLRTLLESCVDDLRERFGVPGAAVVAFDETGVLGAVAAGTRSIEDPAPMTLETLFRLHSMTKMITSVTLLRLRDLGKLDLDSTLAELAPELVAAAPELLAPLTVGQLMSHTSGLPDGPTEIAGDSRDPSGLRRQTAALAPSLVPMAPPGRAYSYSNYAYSVLGAAVEELTGNTYPDVVADLVAGPLGLRSLCFDPIVAMTHPLSQQHPRSRGRLVVDHWYGESVRMYPAAMAFLSPLDLARLGRMYLCDGLVPDSADRFLAADSVAAQRHRQVDIGLVDDRHYGLGTYVGPTVGGTDVFGHEGYFTGMWCDLLVYPGQRCGIVWCDNRGEDPELSDARRAAITTVARALGVPDHHPERAPAGPPPHPAALVGTYVRRGARPVEVLRDGDGLALRLGRTTMPLTHHAGTVHRLDVPRALLGRAPLTPHSGSGTPAAAFHLADGTAGHLSLNGILYGRES